MAIAKKAYLLKLILGNNKLASITLVIKCFKNAGSNSPKKQSNHLFRAWSGKNS
ncbi:hypothetical protein COO91_00845 [Nostoc flagelliforme CCNUN1]|uniref:Uncharacterized protein n=1 Tax=Nostoc flagelliforme CCNUN1 TaxID=2038116 RepID=A0A2K8SHT8_9NOSO|nr:hypothetical protein COO91_00845 [Nostoc flagelliforme CCNUN1]